MTHRPGFFRNFRKSRTCAFSIFGKRIFRKYVKISESAYLFPKRNTGGLIRFFAPIVTRRAGAGGGAIFTHAMMGPSIDHKVQIQGDCCKLDYPKQPTPSAIYIRGAFNIWDGAFCRMIICRHFPIVKIHILGRWFGFWMLRGAVGTFSPYGGWVSFYFHRVPFRRRIFYLGGMFRRVMTGFPFFTIKTDTRRAVVILYKLPTPHPTSIHRKNTIRLQYETSGYPCSNLRAPLRCRV